MSASPSSVRQLARLTVQHDLPDVIREIKQGMHAAEDCWISAYLKDQSVHGKARLSEAEGTAVGVEAAGRDGVTAALVSQVSA